MTADEWEAEYTRVLVRNLARLRESAGYTIEQFARRCDEVVGEHGKFKPNTMQALFAGKRKTVTATEIVIFARALEVPVVAVLTPLRRNEYLSRPDGSEISRLEAWGQLTGLYPEPGQRIENNPESRRVRLLAELARSCGELRLALDLLLVADLAAESQESKFLMDPTLVVERARFHLAACKALLREDGDVGVGLFDETDPLLLWINSTDPEMLTHEVIRDFFPPRADDAQASDPA